MQQNYNIYHHSGYFENGFAGISHSISNDIMKQDIDYDFHAETSSVQYTVASCNIMGDAKTYERKHQPARLMPFRAFGIFNLAGYL